MVESNPTPKCLDCGNYNLYSYEHGCLLGDKPKRNPLSLFFKKKLTLEDGIRFNTPKYKCPKCREDIMEFQIKGLWD